MLRPGTRFQRNVVLPRSSFRSKASPPQLPSTPVMPAKAGTALPHPSCLRRQASHFHARHACEGRRRTSTPVMPAKAGIALPHPSCLRRQASHLHSSVLRRSFQAEQELSSACGSRVTFLLRGQEKSNQKRRPPRLALAGLLSGKSVSRGRAFQSDSCPSEKEPTSLSTPATRPVDPDSPPHRGPGRAAGHPGPHSVRNRVAVAEAGEPTSRAGVPVTGLCRGRADHSGRSSGGRLRTIFMVSRLTVTTRRNSSSG